MDFKIAQHLGEADHPKDFDRALNRIVAANKTMLPKLDRAGQRAQHPKAHATVEASFVVRELPPEHSALQIGLFSRPNTEHRARIRFSNSNQMIDNPKGGDAHGMAIKVLGVPGEKFQPDPSGADTHDFILLNNETFFDGNLQRYEKLNRLAGAALSFARNRRPFLRGILSFLQVKFFTTYMDPELGQAITQTSDQFPVSPLLETYFSTTPYLLGSDTAVKYKVTPKGQDGPPPALVAPDPNENYLTQQMRASLLDRDHHFLLSVQIKRKGDDRFPIENPNQAWTGAEEVVLAELHIPKHTSLTDAEWQTLRFGHETQSYNIWNVGRDHRPLGVLNRLRRVVYKELHRTRTDLDGEVYR